MAISHKGKRKIRYKENLYLWNILKDDDHGEYDVNIVSDDKKLHLSYRTNQIGDPFIHPKITVLKSDKLQKGTYPFFPPIADEVISNHNVGAILNWHDNQASTAQPILFEMPKNPFENIHFKGGIVKHMINDFASIIPGKDILQVTFPKNYELVVSWHGSESGYQINILRDNDRENPVAKTNKSYYELKEAIIAAIEIIESKMQEPE